jgi:HlyD family secretion protein
MNTVIPGVSRKPFIKKKGFKIIAIILVVALLAGGAYYFVKIKNGKANTAVAQRTTTVTKGQITDSIAGSAPIEASDRSEISSKVTATLEKINVKEGDQVKAGDELFVLDNTDALLDIENAQNSINQMQLTLDDTAKSISGLTVKAPFSGQVTNVSIKEGDTVNKDGTLMTITDVSKLDVTLSFSGSEAKNIKVGQNATVYLQDLMLSVDGSVTYVSAKPYAAASGGEIYNVEIQVENPGSLKSDMKATAEITVDGIVLDSVESGTLSYKSDKVLKSDAGGTVSKLNVRENEFVNAGDLLVKLDNNDLILTSSTNNMKMDNLKAQLEILQKQLTYYKITATFDGTITKMGSVIEGDTASQGTTLAVLSNVNHLEFAVDIDELDISSLAVGQEVKITSDAIEETATTPLTGKVTNVAMEGTSSNGVTTYPVTVTVDDESAAKLKTGMNIDAEIIIADKSDILRVPLEAVTEQGGKSYVYVKGASSGSSGNQTGGSNNGTFGGPPDGSTSGSGFKGGAPADGTSGSAMRTPRTDNTSGAGMRGTPPTGNTSGGAMNRQNNRSGSTSQGAVKGSFARARNEKADTYYDGSYMVEVETGISNDTYIEITSGLTEGQTIVLPKTSTVKTTTTTENNSRNGGGMMTGGGGMPSGGGGGGPGGF